MECFCRYISNKIVSDCYIKINLDRKHSLRTNLQVVDKQSCLQDSRFIATGRGVANQHENRKARSKVRVRGTRLRSDQSWSRGGECGSVSCGGCSLDTGDLGESNTPVSVLDGVSSLAIRIGDDEGLDDMDGISSGAVSSSHLRVHVRDGSTESVGSVLLVHVNNTGS